MLRVSFLLLFVGALCARPAAAQSYFDGTNQSTETNCPVTGTHVTVLQVRAGFFTNGTTFPKTGDIGYVHAVATNVSPCVNDTVGFDFFLPDGAVLAISQANPVYCWIAVNGGQPGLVPPSGDPNGSCSQTPLTGNYGGLFFGWHKLAPTGSLEIQVPVLYTKKLLGIGGPTSHRLTVAVSSVYTPSAIYQNPFQPVTAFYQASFTNVVTNAVTATTATPTFDVNSFFETGQLFVDYGTTTGYGSADGPVAVPNTSASFPGTTDTMSGLTPSQQYHWRARLVTASGTFTSPDQTFTTSGASSQLLTVQTTPNGGTVTSNPAGINCGLTCSTSFSTGSSVTLTASPAAGWRFDLPSPGWGNACAAFGNASTCSVTMNAAKTATATFIREMGSLTLTLDGLPGGSSVTIGISGPDGLNTTRTLTQGFGVNLSDVATGTVTITAPTTTLSGGLYAPNAASQNAQINFGSTTTVNLVYSLQGASAPPNVTAKAVTPTSVSVTWTPTNGQMYEVQRIAAGGVMSTVGSTSTGSFTDSTVTANKAYLYKVRVTSPSTSPFSDPDLATTVIFTTPTIVPGATPIMAAHITELRTAVNAVRELAGLPPGFYDDPTLVPGSTLIRAAHIVQLRAALGVARLALSLPPGIWVVIGAGSPVSALDISSLRAGVQ